MLTVEHLNFIAGMVNKYDYSAYLSFCSARMESAISFMAFAAIVDPQAQPVQNVVNAVNVAIDPATQKPCCGGGQVK